MLLRFSSDVGHDGKTKNLVFGQQFSLFCFHQCLLSFGRSVFGQDANIFERRHAVAVQRKRIQGINIEDIFGVVLGKLVG